VKRRRVDEPVCTFEGVLDLTNREGSGIRIRDRNLSQVLDAVAAHLLEIDVGHRRLWLRHVRHFFRHFVRNVGFSFVQQVRHFQHCKYRTHTDYTKRHLNTQTRSHTYRRQNQTNDIRKGQTRFRHVTTCRRTWPLPGSRIWTFGGTKE